MVEPSADVLVAGRDHAPQPRAALLTATVLAAVLAGAAAVDRSRDDRALLLIHRR